ncbi:MAG TPA: HAMP domain-containing sensor histidine kinase [Kofleriaceae bacterium]|jgi:signal transduction histidine kinase|nr:HAMP domain-containing sensor histidine kinase [Kofleriaceae bacterium]
MDLSTVLAALDSVVLDRIADGRFERKSGAPSWWHALVDEPSGSIQPLVISDVFPFLSAFLPDAERAWSSAVPSPIASELWTQTDAARNEIHLEATAARVDDSAVLVIARNDQAFFGRQLLLQRARELRLTHDALMREIEREDILLHTIVHDLAAPLHSIMGSLSLLRALDLPPAAGRWTEIAVQAAARQRQLIQGILHVFVAEQSGAETIPPGGVELLRAMERAVSEREPVARQRQVTLAMHPTGSFRIAADETRLLRVLTNLVDNAIRHSPPGKQVSMTAVAEDGSVQLSIDDEGSGVSPDMLPNLFQKLARDPRGGGTGLGLYFCRITVELWGGGIGYEPRPSGGARFWIRLPIAATGRDDRAQKVDHG